MRQHLRLVEFDPSDYSLGDALLGAETTKLADRQKLSAALSLYFQWPSYRRALVYQSNSGSTIGCQIDRDPDEAEASVLFLHLDPTAAPPFNSEDNFIRVRFEVFRTCYEMNVPIIGRACDNDGAGWDFAVSVPNELVLFKHRRLPRVHLDASMSEKLGLTLKQASDSPAGSIKLNIQELSMKSIVATTSAPLTADKPVLLVVGDLELPVVVVRTSGDQVVLSLEFETGEQAGKFFDFYRLAAYPQLRARSDVDNTALLGLYRKTGYIDRYQPSDEGDRETKEILETWDELDRHAKHESVADYVACDANDRLVGSSGLARAFKRNGQDVWFLNQLCALTEPELLEESGALYQWRSEYLVGRPESLSVMVRYWSNSRWLERVYTKFAMSSEGVQLVPIKTYRKTFIADRTLPNLPDIHLGSWKRPLLDEPAYMGAIFPKHLNLATALDAIFACWDEAPTSEVEIAAQRLVASSSLDSYPIALALAPNALAPDNATTGKTDRMVFFDKSTLVDFLTFTEHIIAVSKRKHGVQE